MAAKHDKGTREPERRRAPEEIPQASPEEEPAKRGRLPKDVEELIRRVYATRADISGTGEATASGGASGDVNEREIVARTEED